MADLARQMMTEDEFFAWLQGQERKYELVDGVPMMMTGVNRRHDTVTVNTIISLGNQLRGRPCRPFTADTAIRIPAGNIRYPDAGVDCGRPADLDMAAAEPMLVVEILSPSTRTFDSTTKLEEYKTVPGLGYILLVDPDTPQARLYTRDNGGIWETSLHVGLEAEVMVPRLDVVLRLADLYHGLEFRDGPREV